jgi:hypothetical protein
MYVLSTNDFRVLLALGPGRILKASWPKISLSMAKPGQVPVYIIRENRGINIGKNFQDRQMIMKPPMPFSQGKKTSRHSSIDDPGRQYFARRNGLRR